MRGLIIKMRVNLDNLYNEIYEVGSTRFCRETGTSSGNISDWRSGRSSPSTEKLIRCAEYFNCSIDYLLGRTHIRESNNSNYIYMPVFEQKASAGTGLFSNDGSSISKDICFEISKVPIGVTHGIIIEGDSMEPKFFNGQIVFINVNKKCGVGDYGIFNVITYEGSKIFCKQLMQDKIGHLYLHSVNRRIEDPDIKEKEFINYTCIGKIIE